MSLIQHFVNGKSYKGNSNRKGKVFNPATGEQESEVILGSKEDLNNTAKGKPNFWEGFPIAFENK